MIASTHKPRISPAIPGLAWFVGSISFLAVYYKQIWRLFSLGPSSWFNENPSLKVDPILWKLIRSGPAAWNLPDIREAFFRATHAAWGAGLILFTALILGEWLLRSFHWQPGQPVEALVYRVAIGLGAFSYILFGLAGLNLYRQQAIQILVALIILLGGLYSIGIVGRYIQTNRRTHAYERAETDNIRERSRYTNVLKNIFRLNRNTVWVIITCAAILAALIGALAPEIEYDALWYHLWLPKIWLQNGRPVDILGEYPSLYPLTWELVYGAGLVLGGPVAAKLVNFACLPLSILLVVNFSRRKLPGLSPWLGAALFATTPTVLWEATTAYNDLALTLYTFLAVYALIQYMEQKNWQWLLLVGINLGLALAIKHLAIILWLFIPGALCLWLWIEQRDLRRAVLPALLLGVLCLVAPLPWYIRSWHASGNPFFPELFKIFGASPPTRWDAITETGLDHFKAQFGYPRTFANWLALPWNMTIHAASYQGTFGPLFILLIPGLLLARRWVLHVSFLFFFVLTYFVFWASPLSSFQIRFLIPITPVLTLLAAEGYTHLNAYFQNTAGKRGQRFFQASIAVLLLLNLPPFLSLHEGDRVGWEGWLNHVNHEIPISVVTGIESQETYLKRMVPSYSAWMYINTHIPPGARILTFSSGDQFYAERDRIWSDATLARPATWGAQRGEEQQALSALAQIGVTHVLLDMRYIGAYPPETLAIAQPEVLKNRFVLEYEDDRFRLYRFRKENN